MYISIVLSNTTITVIGKDADAYFIETTFGTDEYKLNPKPVDGRFNIHRIGEEGEDQFPFPPILSMPAIHTIVDTSGITVEESQDEPGEIES